MGEILVKYEQRFGESKAETKTKSFRKGVFEKMKKNILLRALAATLAVSTIAGCLVGCNKPAEPAVDPAAPSASDAKEIKEFSMFIAMPGSEINDDNVVQAKLAELYGAKIKETWLTGQTAEEAIGVMVAGGEYTDFIEASDGYQMMVDAGALIAIDEYWDNYPNIKNYLSEAEWNMCRKPDGHIYAIPQFGIINDHDVTTIHNDQAFWIQTRVLKWAGYPQIDTLDDFFKVIEEYYAANPDHIDGTKVIPYTILCEDWRYFCLENAPFYLDGYPNDGCVIVDPSTKQAIDYNTTETAKKYFAKLNEEYKKGIVDPESFTQSYDEYISKLSTGRVLAFNDQYWNWGYTAEAAIKTLGVEDEAYNECTYVPLGLTIEAGIKDRYHSASALDVSGGMSITTSCKDIEGALQFVDDMLNQDALTLRFWGIEGQDYLVDENGLFYRTEEMRNNSNDATYKAANLCAYSYLPQYEGMNLDGINAWSPGNQPAEFFEGLLPQVKECLEAYGAETYVEMLDQAPEKNSEWYPLWSWSNDLTTDSGAHGEAWAMMGEVKHEWLPKVCIAEDFEAEWENYMKVYNERCDIQAFLDAATAEVARRIDVANG